MEIIPSSTLYLCENIDLDPNYNYTMDFDTIEAQEDYFDSKIYDDFEANEDYQYIRDTRAIKVPANINDLLNINYLFFNNGNKRYYAFIIHKDYIHANCTALTFKIDVMQTFMFDYEIDESFIDREQQDRYFNDNGTLKPIYNTKDENLNIGTDYEQVDKEDLIGTGGHVWYYVYAKEPLGKLVPTYGGTAEDDHFSTNISASTGSSVDINTGYYVYMFTQLLPFVKGTYNFNFTALDTFIDNVRRSLLEDNRVIKIVASRYKPHAITWDSTNQKYIIGSDGLSTRICLYDKYDADYPFNKLLKIENFVGADFGEEFTVNDIISNPISLSINNLKNINNEPKINTSPYSIIRLNVFNKYINLKRENFNTLIDFRITQGIINNTNLIIQPLDYLGEDSSLFNLVRANIDNQINLRTDAWEEYVTQNSASINGGLAVDAFKFGGTIGFGLATGGIGLAVAGIQAISEGAKIANEMIRREDIKNTPDEVKQASCDSFTPVLLNELLANVEFVEIKEEFKKSIFNYFYHYGYKCNDFKKPNIRSRYYFNYIKTIGANIKGNIDGEFKTNIMEIYDKGITIWHYRNSLTFKGVNNYDYENVEMNLMEE